MLHICNVIKDTMREREGLQFGKLTAHGDRGAVQIEALSGQIQSDVPHPQDFGFESLAPIGASTVSAYKDGDQDGGAVLIVAGKAPIQLGEGDSVQYSSGGAYVKCTGSQIEINGVAYGGLVKINELTAKVNALISELQLHSHNTGGGPTSSPVQTFTPLNASDYENGDVQHG